MNNTALETYLEPLNEIFSDDEVNEVSINREKEVWIERAGKIYDEKIEEFNFNHLKGLARLIAQSTEQKISEETPLLSARLPNGYRIQVVFPPACDTVAMSIRKPSTKNFSLADYEEMGAFDDTKTQAVKDTSTERLRELITQNEIKKCIEFAVESRKNIIISGGTSTGKTTFTNAILQEIPTKERLITVEDTREIMLPKHLNRVHLIASKGGQGRAKVTIQDLLECCLRMCPSRIIIGELRGSEAFSFLRAINTGHPGSIATVHADSPRMAIEQLKLMVMQAGLNIPEAQIENYIRFAVDFVFQLKRDPVTSRRYISEVAFVKDME